MGLLSYRNNIALANVNLVYFCHSICDIANKIRLCLGPQVIRSYYATTLALTNRLAIVGECERIG